MALHRDKGSPPEVDTSGGLRPNRCEAAAPVDGHSAGFGGVGVPQAVATATEGADLRQTQRAVRGFAPVPCSMPALGMVQNKKKAPTPCGAGASLFCWCAIY